MDINKQEEPLTFTETVVSGEENRLEETQPNEVVYLKETDNLRRRPKATSEKKPFECDACEKSYSHVGTLRHHVRTTHERRFRCDNCGKAYSSGAYLRLHREASRGRCDPTRFKCDICAKSFASVAGRRAHEQARGEHVECDVCGRQFARSNHLWEHKRTHSDRFERRGSRAETEILGD